jgi:amidase
MKIDEKFPLLSTPGCIARTPNDLALLLDAISGVHASDPYSFDPPSSFRKSHISDDEFLKIRVGWLGDLNKQYTFEDGILNMCENVLKRLDEDFLSVNQDTSIINTSDLWHSWTTLRAKNNYLYLEEANLQEHPDLGFGAQWELEKSKELKTEDLMVAFSQRDECKKTADELFSKYDFLVMPSAQVFPFEKEKDYPKKISDKNMDSYHRWMEVVTFSSLLGLPSISIPVGFSKLGLPMGMQIIGKKGNDLNVVAFAKKYEEIFNHSANRPKGF